MAGDDRARRDRGRDNRSGKEPIELRLDLPLATDAPFSTLTGPGRAARSRFSGRPVSAAHLAGVALIALLLGWTVYYDLLSDRPRHPGTPPIPSEPSVVEAAPFPANGTVIAVFRASDVAGGGVTLRTPPMDHDRLFIVAVQDWQTGGLVARVFLHANTIATVGLPPGRYRLLFASGSTWQGDVRMFGSKMRVAETLAPVEIDTSQTKSISVSWGGGPVYPTAVVPANVLTSLVLGQSR